MNELIVGLNQMMSRKKREELFILKILTFVKQFTNISASTVLKAFSVFNGVVHSIFEVPW